MCRATNAACLARCFLPSVARDTPKPANAAASTTMQRSRSRTFAIAVSLCRVAGSRRLVKSGVMRLGQSRFRVWKGRGLGQRDLWLREMGIGCGRGHRDWLGCPLLVGQTECAPLRKSLTWQLLMLPWLIEDSVGQDAHTSGRGGTATIGSGAISTSGEPRSDYRSVWSSSMFEMLGLIFQEGFLA